MADDKDNKTENKNLQAGIIATGGSTISAGRDIIVDIKKMQQQINSHAGVGADAKAQLLAELVKLQEALSKVDEENKALAEKVAKYAEGYVDEVTSEKPDKDLAEAQGNALKKAAGNIKEVLPDVIDIALKIIAAAAFFM